jgi:hydroxylamine reductase
MATLLLPGRHVLNTRFQETELTRLLTISQTQLPTFGKAPASGPIARLVFAISSANQSNSRYNPVPLEVRSIGVDRFARRLKELLGITYRIVPIPHYGPTERFASFVLKELCEATEGELELTPENTILFSSTPSVIAQFRDLGFSVLTGELETCNQCEQASQGIGCASSVGICGKSADVQSLQDIILYGLKGMATYAHHARRLGKSDESVSAFLEEALFTTMTNVNFDIPSLLDIAMKLGQMNLRVMELLDAGHIEKFGKPAPTKVREGTHAGPGILITGHDMLDLLNLLKACEGTNVKVYTHGEMIPAHMYPELGKHPNMGGQYGSAWQKQKTEFADFPGPIVATTNCIMIPPSSYSGRMYTTRVTHAPGATRIVNDNFGPVVKMAQTCEPCRDQYERSSTIGFHRTVLLDAAPTIVQAVKDKKISHFYVIGGCDGHESSRNYFNDFATATPKDSFILTLGCGKYRIRTHDYGELLGLPRLLDMGQCNDAYGAIMVATALAKAFNCSVNDLPLTLCISWLEQKAVAVLLTLLSLGVKGISIGPNPPAFITPNVFRVLQDKFDLKLTPTRQEMAVKGVPVGALNR